MRSIIFFLFSFLLACNNTTTTTNTITDSSADAMDTAINPAGNIPISDSSLQGCYSLINGKDTASLEIGFDKGNVTGSLSYHLSGKDRNDGTFQGEINGDLVKVWYLFRSEGIMSVRQEIWKILPGKLVPGTGEVMQSRDTMLFKDVSRLDFDSTRAFRKVACVI